MASYCVKYRAKTNDVSPQPAVTKNGRPMIKSQCRVCGKRKSRFTNKAQSRNSEFLGGSLGSLFGKYKVTAPVTKEVAKKLFPAFGMAAVTGAISGATHKAAAE